MHELTRIRWSRPVPGALIAAARPRFTWLQHRARMTVRAAIAGLERIAEVRGQAAIGLRLGVPMLVGGLLCSPVLNHLPAWAVVLTVLAIAALLTAFVRVLWLDEGSRLADKIVLDVREARITALTHRAEKADLSARQSSDHAAYCERLVQHASEAETDAQRKAATWRHIAKAAESHWEIVSGQNADGYAQLSAVVMSHLTRIGGEEALAAVRADLARLERAEVRSGQDQKGDHHVH